MQVMANEKNKLIKVPTYSLGEELISAISHGIGAGLGITALVLCIIMSAIHGNASAVVSSCIYGSTLIVLYTISTLYHSFKSGIKAKKVFRVLDHCSIFLLIFGSYTPVALVTLKGAIGWTIFSVILAAAILGIVLNSINLEKYKKISMVCYLVMGWTIILAIKPMIELIDLRGIMFLVLRRYCIHNRCNNLWTWEKNKIYAFYLALLCFRWKYFAIFRYIFICYISKCYNSRPVNNPFVNNYIFIFKSLRLPRRFSL